MRIEIISIFVLALAACDGGSGVGAAGDNDGRSGPGGPEAGSVEGQDALDGLPQHDPGRQFPGACAKVVNRSDIAVSCSSLAYDAEELLVSLTDARGRIAFGYNAEGQVVTETFDFLNDGMVDSRWTHVYAAGNRVATEYDHQADGVPDWKANYTLDSDGKVVLEEWDDDMDGVTDWRWSFQYDPKGGVVFRDYDEAADDIPDGMTWSTCDAFGTEIIVADEAWSHTYDDTDRITQTDYDRGADGDVDSRTTYEYDDAANSVVVSFDKDGDGTIEWRRTLISDAWGNKVQETFDEDMDGLADEIVAYDYSCWAAGAEPPQGTCVGVCVADHDRRCIDDDSFWIDSCGYLGTLAEACSAPETCSGGVCKSDEPPCNTLCKCQCPCGSSTIQAIEGCLGECSVECKTACSSMCD